jgi:hypothetical protein
MNGAQENSAIAMPFKYEAVAQKAFVSLGAPTLQVLFLMHRGN